MCGFFGVVSFSEHLTPNDYEEIIAGSQAISYRGPDDSGYFQGSEICIGFQRLSIIDLNAHSQPYSNEDGSILMVCNGEIYNFRILRATLQEKGYQFITNTDSEVLVHGYEEWGTSLWDYLNGMYAIALWDKKKKKLHLVRDRLGVKPLHYMSTGGRVYFGSDYNSFFKQTWKKIEPNPQALMSYFSFRYVVGEQTFYKVIKNVLPGNFSSFDTNTSIQTAYWDIPIETEEDRGEKHYLHALGEKISDSVNLQRVSDVPLGAFVSGGLDSSILLYYLAKKQTNINAYISGFDEEGYNEFYYADIVAEALKITSNKLTLKLDEYISNMDEVIAYRGEPVSVPHEAAFLKMSRFLKKDITVVLSGEGADELFGGYGRIFRSPFDFLKSKYLDAVSLPSFKLDNLFGGSLPRRFHSPSEHFLWRYSWFNEEDKKHLLNMDYFNNQFFDEYSLSYVTKLFDKAVNQDYYRTMFYIMGKLHLVNLLNRLDRMTMAASVEARVPFLDHELVEFVSRMPVKHKLKWNSKFAQLKSLFYSSDQVSEKYDTPKYILKRLAEGKIPDTIINRKKMGFPVPLDKWFSDKLKVKAIELLTDSSAKTKDFTNTANLKKFLSQKNYSSDYDYDGKKIWMLMNLEIWLRKTFP